MASKNVLSYDTVKQLRSQYEYHRATEIGGSEHVDQCQENGTFRNGGDFHVPSSLFPDFI